MKATAQLRHLNIAPRKVNMVAKLVRGMEVGRAEAHLRLLTKRAALPVQKLMLSALANARHNLHAALGSTFFVQEIVVTQAPMLKRRFPRSRGRSDVKRKRRSHIRITLDDRN